MLSVIPFISFSPKNWVLRLEIGNLQGQFTPSERYQQFQERFYNSCPGKQATVGETAVADRDISANALAAFYHDQLSVHSSPGR